MAVIPLFGAEHRPLEDAGGRRKVTQVRRRIVEFIFGAQWQSVVP
ncbi:MAG: hypothetical protein V3W36_07220 [Acidimicrobiia bacterium]